MAQEQPSKLEQLFYNKPQSKMKIIGVNIHKALSKKSTVINATERAWLLNKSKCAGFDYVIGVAGGQIKGYFKLNGVSADRKEPKRVKFDITACNTKEIRLINSFLGGGGHNLGHFVTKYF